MSWTLHFSTRMIPSSNRARLLPSSLISFSPAHVQISPRIDWSVSSTLRRGTRILLAAFDCSNVNYSLFLDPSASVGVVNDIQWCLCFITLIVSIPQYTQRLKLAFRGCNTWLVLVVLLMLKPSMAPLELWTLSSHLRPFSCILKLRFISHIAPGTPLFVES